MHESSIQLQGRAAWAAISEEKRGNGSPKAKLKGNEAMSLHTVGSAEAPDLEEGKYSVIVVDAQPAESSFGDKTRIKVTFGVEGQVDAEGDPLQWGEYLNVTLGSRSNLTKLISLLFFNGEEVPKGTEFDDEDCTVNGDHMLSRTCELQWRTRIVENPQTHEEKEKTGWDIEYTYERARIEKRKSTGKGGFKNAGEFMLAATEEFDMTPKRIKEILQLEPHEIKDFDKAWKHLEDAKVPA